MLVLTFEWLTEQSLQQSRENPQPDGNAERDEPDGLCFGPGSHGAMRLLVVVLIEVVGLGKLQW